MAWAPSCVNCRKPLPSIPMTAISLVLFWVTAIAMVRPSGDTAGWEGVRSGHAADGILAGAVGVHDPEGVASGTVRNKDDLFAVEEGEPGETSENALVVRRNNWLPSRLTA